jgi:hypothetical protein
MGRACSTHGEKKNACRILMGNPERKRPLGRRRHRCEDNVKTDHREMGWGYVDWIGPAQDRDQWSTVVYTVMNLGVPQNVGKFLSS